MTTEITIKQERPDTADATQLIAELEAYLIPLSPPESRHGYSVEKLIKQNVQFFVIREGDSPAGCGGVQFYEVGSAAAYGELKRMYVRPDFRGRGLAQRLLGHLESVTAAQGIGLVRLETGIAQKEAARLYEKWGFYLIPPFGDYRDDPNSRYYEKVVTVSVNGAKA